MVKKQFQIQAYTSAPNHVKSGQGLRAFRSSLEGPFFTRSPEMKPFRTIRLQCESNHLRLTYRSCSQEKCAPPAASQTGILAWSILMMRAFVVSYMFLLYNCEQEPHVNFADLLGIPYVKVLQFVSFCQIIQIWLLQIVAVGKSSTKAALFKRVIALFRAAKHHCAVPRWMTATAGIPSIGKF